MMSHTFSYPEPLREWLFVVQISLPIFTILSLISRTLSSMQTTQEVNPHLPIVSCVNMWSVTFLFLFSFRLCHLLNVGACVHQIAREGQVEWTTLASSNCPYISFVLFHNVTHYTNSIVSCIHVTTTKFRNITCTLVATGVIPRSLGCTSLPRHVSNPWPSLMCKLNLCARVI